MAGYLSNASSNFRWAVCVIGKIGTTGAVKSVGCIGWAARCLAEQTGYIRNSSSEKTDDADGPFYNPGDEVEGGFILIMEIDAFEHAQREAEAQTQRTGALSDCLIGKPPTDLIGHLRDEKTRGKINQLQCELLRHIDIFNEAREQIRTLNSTIRMLKYNDERRVELKAKVVRIQNEHSYLKGRISELRTDIANLCK